jgi:glycosyltransferase involved in cell wall biosynthesis
MRILVVCSAKNGHAAPFIEEQAMSLRKLGIEIDYYYIEKKGIVGYLSALSGLKKKITLFQPSLIHAHYGLSGLLANLQRKVPVITTFHGSDINDPKVRKWSKIAIKLSRYSIFVSQKTLDIARPKKNFALIPCGIDLTEFYPIKKEDARRQLGWSETKRYILFAGGFDNEVKNSPLAKAASAQLPDVELVALIGFSRQQVNLLINGSDVALLTSFTEGSPQFIKEAMACNCPIVATNVGDIKQLIDGIEGCYCTSFEVNDVAEKLKMVLHFAQKNGKTSGREKLGKSSLSLADVATQIELIYKKCTNAHE